VELFEEEEPAAGGLTALEQELQQQDEGQEALPVSKSG